MKEFEEEELSQGDGRNGRPAYLAFQGKVFDASQSRFWKGGRHMQRHQAGGDLTAEIQGAPHGPEVLERITQVGVLKERAREPVEVRFLSALLARFPILRRHPHPMIVHFPIVFLLSAPGFNFLSLVCGMPSFEMTALHTLGAGILFTPLAILTGFFTWQVNYLARPMRPVTIKIRGSFLLLACAGGAFIWRLAVPDLLHSPSGWGTIYFLLTLALIPLVVVVGWYGAQLTFPLGIRKEVRTAKKAAGDKG